MASRKNPPGQLGLFRPDTDWKLPRELPDLRGRPVVAIDSETKDDGLSHGKGPGWALGPMGRILGVSWAAEGSVGYAPTSHPDTENFDVSTVMRWLDDLFRSGTRVVFHNGPYDIGWFGTHGVAPPENMEDTLPACVFLDESHRQYNLDACCRREGIPGKDEALIREAVESYGGSRSNVKGDLWRLPAAYVGPYAEQDGVATLDLWRRCEPALKAQGVWDAYRTEIDLIPMVVAMRRRGIRIDTERAMETSDEFREVSARHLKEIGDGLGMRRAASMEEIRSPSWMANMCAIENISFPKTPKGKQGSFSKDWMEKHDHWFPRAVTQALKFEDAASKFMDNFILGFSNRGRVHSEVHQFKSDDGGTKSHRFSYSEPPLQQMTSPDKDPRDKETGELIWDRAIGTKVRDCFLPEEGERWLGADYSQQEPRITVHFAAACRAEGAEAAVERYLNNPRTDYHTMVAEMTGKPRPIAKILNLGMTYGKGKRSLAAELGLPLDEAEVILNDYHRRLPFIKSLENICKRRAGDRGYIRLIDGARMHFSEWEGGYIEYEEREAARRAGKKLDPCSLEEARERQADPDHPWSRTRLRRADTRKALNYLVQGSAARQTKRAMLQCWKEGILPLIQMHDEIGCSVSDERTVLRIGEIMREATPLIVPVVVDLEVGPTWGRAKSSWAEADEKYGRLSLAA